MKKSTLFLSAAALVMTLGAATAAPAGIKTMGDVLVDKSGMTLYTFDKDSKGASNCYDGCAANWPPMEVGAYAKDDGWFTVVKRADGGKQWAYYGAPLYYWINDAKPGDKSGDGVGGVWHVIAK